MKKCANCGFECGDEDVTCPACTADAFISSSPEALGHIVSPEEQSYWERMTFRQFAVFFVRLQAVWLLFNGFLYATYLVEYLVPTIHFTRIAWLVLTRGLLHFALAFICIRYADRIVSWCVKDLIPKTPPNKSTKE